MQTLRCEVWLLQCTAPPVYCLPVCVTVERALWLDKAVKLHFLSTTGPWILIIEAIFSHRRRVEG